eukprot:gb/GFBE01078999.1/.p1 GENE.gb/GFBE01078999.1/~~gb/GFBE01078999.1/.p1  ORF type:complete len:392 (+),score=86.76 gb/GFBE01078999.1/:1-1176(+)
MSSIVRRRGLAKESEKVDPVLQFVLDRDRRLEAGLARRNSKTKPGSSSSQVNLRPGSGGSPLAHSGSEVLLGVRRALAVDTGKQEHASSSSTTEVLPRRKDVRRRWTVDLSAEQDNDVLSPKWTKPVARRACNRLSIDEVADVDNTASNLSRHPTLEDGGDAPDEADEMTTQFVELCGKLRGVVSQTTIRTAKFFDKIRAAHKDKPAMLQEKQNFERLSSVSFLVATTNYRISKWLYQLAPSSYVKPSKPVDAVDEHRTVDELLREVQFSLSRMEVLASDLVPKLQKILSDAKAVSDNPRFLVRHNNASEAEPLSPGCANPVRLARKKGIRDVREMQGIISHLERLLEVAHSLAYRPAGAAQVKVTATIIMAAARFKKGLQKRKARKAAAS